MVKNAWCSFDTPVDFDAMKGLVFKLKWLKLKVVDWEKEYKRCKDVELISIYLDINLIFLQSPTGILSSEDTLQLAAIKARKEIILSHELSTW